MFIFSIIIFSVCLCFHTLIFLIFNFVHMHMMPKLITLLTVNRIGDAGATQLADALRRNSTLTGLFLGGKHDMIYAVVSFMIKFFIASCSFSFRFLFYFLLHFLSFILPVLLHIYVGCLYSLSYFVNVFALIN